jgi:hypothetical protein
VALIAVLFTLVTVPAMAINPGTDVVVAAGGSAPGVPPSFWTTDLIVFNPGNTPATVSVYYLPRGSDNSAAVPINFTVQAHRTLVRPNVVGTDFGVEGFGALRVTSDLEVVVNSVTNNLPSGGSKAEEGSFGQGFPGIPVSAAVTAGDSGYVIGLNQDDIERSSFGAVDVSGSGSRVRVSLLDAATGQAGTSKDYTLRPWEPFQKKLGNLGAGAGTVGTLKVEVLEGAVVTYATKANNGSGDGLTLERSWSCGAGRATADGTYFFVTKAAGGDLTGGGSLTVSGGMVTELCGNMLALDKQPACAYWLAYCTDGPVDLTLFAAGNTFDVTYTSGGADVGTVSWTLMLNLTDNIEVAGTLDATGSSWTGSDTGCDGAFPSMTVFGGVSGTAR